MKFLVALSVLVIRSYSPSAQITLTQLPSGGNKKAVIGERVGLTDILINYSRPAVKGREGKIWGDLIPVGYIDQGFGSGGLSPWRAGANESTTIEFSNDVIINGSPLKKGKYGFFIAYSPEESTVIFSSVATDWGSYYYNQAEDALRVNVKPERISNKVEWLKYEFSDQTENAATISLFWEKLKIPFRVETDYIKHQIESFRTELRTQRGFYWLPWNQAAQWCLQRNVNLEQALQWSDSATSATFGGNNQFPAKVTRAQLLEKLGRKDEGRRIIRDALPLGGMNELHNYARNLVSQGRTQEAMEIFQFNYKKFPDQFTSLIGMTRGYSAVADYKKARRYAEKALPLAPDSLNKSSVETMIKKLEAGENVN